MMLAVMLFAWLVPQTAAAVKWIENPNNYSATLNGANTIRISVPCFNENGYNMWILDGNLKVSWDGGSATCFRWERTRGNNDDDDWLYIRFSTGVGGSFDVTQGNSSRHFTLTKEDGELDRAVWRNSDGDHYTVSAVWTLPYNLLGKTLKFKWDVTRDGNGYSSQKVTGLNDFEITIPAAQDVVYPQVTPATLSYGDPGKLELPWFMGSTKITAARYEYRDAAGNRQWTNLPTNENSGTILLDTSVPHNKFHLVMTYRDNLNYSIDDISSTEQDLTMIHYPVGFTASYLGDRKAKVRLAWAPSPMPTSDRCISPRNRITTATTASTTPPWRLPTGRWATTRSTTSATKPTSPRPWAARPPRCRWQPPSHPPLGGRPKAQPLLPPKGGPWGAVTTPSATLCSASSADTRYRLPWPNAIRGTA